MRTHIYCFKSLHHTWVMLLQIHSQFALLFILLPFPLLLFCCHFYFQLHLSMFYDTRRCLLPLSRRFLSTNMWSKTRRFTNETRSIGRFRTISSAQNLVFVVSFNKPVDLTFNWSPCCFYPSICITNGLSRYFTRIFFSQFCIVFLLHKVRTSWLGNRLWFKKIVNNTY